MTAPAAPTTGPTPNQMPQQAPAGVGTGTPPAAPVTDPATPPAATAPAVTPPAPATPAAAIPPAPAAAPAVPPPAPAPAPAAPAQPAPDAAPLPPANRPPWEASGEPFDPSRAWNLIQGVRTEVATVRGDLANANQRGDTWRDRALNTTAHSMAAARFIDADAALALVGDLSECATDDTGVDLTKLQAKLDNLATTKPHLVAPEGFTPDRGQGQSGTGPLTPAQVAAHAESQQDWKSAGTAKAQQLVNLHQQQ